VISRAGANNAGLASPRERATLREQATPCTQATPGKQATLRIEQDLSLVSQAYATQGYHVSRLSGTADDLMLSLDTARILLRCIHRPTHPVDAQTVCELFGVAATLEATWTIAATSGEFSAEAIALAAGRRLTLLDGPAVSQLISLSEATQTAPGTPFLHPSPVPPPDKHAAANTAKPSGPQPLESPSPQTSEAPRRPPVRRMASWLAIAVPLFAVAIFTAAHLAANPAVSPLQSSSPTSPATAAPAAKVFGLRPLAIATQDGLIYTANYAGGDITVADAKTLTPATHLDVPGKPIAIATDTTHHRLFVADSAAANIYVVDNGTGKVERTIELKAKATAVAFDASRQRLFVVSHAGKWLAVFNTDTLTKLGQVTTTGRPSAVALANHVAYVASDQSVTRYDQYLNKHSALAVTTSPTGLATNAAQPNAAQAKLYVLSGSSLQEYDLRSGHTRTLDVGSGAGALCINESAQVAYVTYPDANKLTAISLS
jgi:hypothetical protein